MTATASIPQEQLEATITRLFENSAAPLSPEELHQQVLAGSGDDVTFAEVRRSVWTLIRRGVLAVTADWKIEPHHG